MRDTGPTTFDEIKPMRLAKAIRTMNARVVWLEGRVEQHLQEGKPVGMFLAELSAIKALILAAGPVQP